MAAAQQAEQEGMIEFSSEDEAFRLSIMQQLEERNGAIAADQEEFDQLVREAEEKCHNCSEPKAPGEEFLCSSCLANADHI
jgi:hypothetical protein